MKIIVTGGAGFIASHITDAYVKSGHKVAVIDNLSTGFKRNLNSKAKFYKADIRNLKLIERIFKKERPEIVNHHAAAIEVVKSVRDPIHTYQTNFLGTTNLLLAFGQRGRGGKFIFSSSGGAIYGNPKKLPAKENTPPLPLSPYALSKFLGEEAIKFHSRQYDFDYLIFRYANIYGPRQNPQGEAGVVAIFGGLMKNGLRPTIFGDGGKSRDYVYIDDVVHANVIGLRKGKNEILNIGWGKKITDQMIFDALAKEIKFKDKPIYALYRKGEVYQISLYNGKAKKILGWRPKIKLEEGIRNTLISLRV